MGLINNTALGETISDFQSEGAFGNRHIYTFPHKIIQQFNSDNELHQEFVKLTKALMKEWATKL